MINENKIREACASNRERGFKMLMDSFQVPIYNYIRRLVVSHEENFYCGWVDRMIQIQK